MTRLCLFSFAVILALQGPANAQAPAWHFRWQQGQALTYRAEHTTTAADVVGGNKTETKTKLNLLKRWDVLEVDAAGAATLRLSVLAMRLENTTPGGTSLVFDSREPEKSDPQMREQLGKYIGQSLAVLRVDRQGSVVEVKESKFGPASRYESEPPFYVVLPEAAPRQGIAWLRHYKITLEPPQGTGDKYDAAQKYVCKSLTPEAAVLTLTTELKTQPEAVSDRMPLLQSQPEGEIVFDLQNGRLHGVSMKIDKELTGHQGEGSSYHFQSMYVERLAEVK